MSLLPRYTARSGDDPAVILPYLVQQRGLTEADLNRVVGCQRAMELSLGEALLHLGLCTPVELEAARSSQQPAPVVAGALPSDLLLVRDPFHAVSEQVRSLRNELSQQHGPSAGVIALVSAHSGDGATQLAAALAIACAQLDQATLLVDADLRKPSLHGLFSLPQEQGLSELLERGLPPRIASIAGLPQLSVLTAGQPLANPLERLSSRPFGDFIEGCRRRYRHVIIATAAAESGADAVTVAAAAGTALLVSRLDHTQLSNYVDLHRRLAAARVKVLAGVLLTSAL